MQLPDLPSTQGRFSDLPADPLRYMRDQYLRHGEISAFQEGNQRLVFAFGPRYNKLILSDPETFHSYFFAVRGPRNSAQRRLSSGLLSMNGARHRRHRRMLMEPFQRRSFAGYVVPIAELIQEMLGQWSPGETRNIHDDMTHFMLRVTSSILFGFDQPQIAYRIGRMIHHWVELSHRVGIAAVDPSMMEHDDYQRLLDFAAELESEIAELIRMRRSSAAHGTDVLSVLIRCHDAQGGLTDDELIGHAALLFGAAHLTTAHSLTWMLLLIAQHPDVAAELSDENAAKLAGRVPTIADFARMPVLERVVKESMRVLPGSAYVQRVNVAPVQLGPYHLPRGTTIVFSQFVTHHMRELYDEPDRFQPERWLSISPSPYAYLPFGAGPRLCIGGPLALVTIKLVIPAVMQRFRLRVQPGADINAKAISTMLCPVTPVPMTVYPADGRYQASPVIGNIHDLVDLPMCEAEGVRGCEGIGCSGW